MKKSKFIVVLTLALALGLSFSVCGFATTSSKIENIEKIEKVQKFEKVEIAKPEISNTTPLPKPEKPDIQVRPDLNKPLIPKPQPPIPNPGPLKQN